MEYKRGSLSNEELIHLYESILWPRMIEEKMLVLLRQGKISKWFSGIGQEAIAVGATLAMDYAFAPKFRCVHFTQNAFDRFVQAMARRQK
jgi:TPP-dependent pyruvate/acetoin dehydrogenase alpha subunit